MSTLEKSTSAGDAGASVVTARSEFDRAKLRPPYVGRSIVARERLLALRPDPAAAPVVSVVAPAGYGKTTVLAEWAEHDSARTLWLSLDTHDNDPITLASGIAAALLESGAGAPGLARAMRARAVTVWNAIMPQLSIALHAASPFTLILDDAHLLTTSESQDVIDWLELHVPSGSQMIVSGRSRSGSSLARLELGGMLATRGAPDLRLDDAEARQLLSKAGAPMDAEAVAQLNRACDGWVSGLLMSGMAAEAEFDGKTGLGDGEQLIDLYLRLEVLERLDPEDREFLLRASVLRLTNASLCDAVLERSDSHQLLERLCEANAFVARVGDGWCKMHDLLRSALLRQLERRDSELVATLSDRAAEWHAHNGNPAEAMQYSIESGRTERTLELIGHLTMAEYGEGRVATVEQWLEWAESNGLMTGNPRTTLAASVFFALTGRAERAERWTATVRHDHGSRHPRARCPEGEGHCVLLAAWSCDRGAEAALTDAGRAVELLAGDQWHKSALACLGVAQLMNRLESESVSTFQQVVDEGGPAWRDTNARSGCADILASLALERRDVDGAVAWLEQSDTIRRENGITEEGQHVLHDAVAARTALVGGRVDEARRFLGHAQALRPLVTWAIPSLALMIRLELARARLALADSAGARVVMREAADIVHHRPGLGAFEDKLHELQASVSEQAEAALGPTSLTAAELRLVPWLATHLSFREIGERLFLSTNTVKTEALSTYRKLGASSRSEAVEAAVRVGLLDSAALPGILGASTWGYSQPG